MGLQMGKPPKSLSKRYSHDTIWSCLLILTTDDGGKIPLRLAIGDIGNSTGDFWENGSISSTEDGKVSVW
jgi:hypothetical protein